jgi:hypothetical protein
MCDVTYITFIELCYFNFAPFIVVHLKHHHPMPHYPTTALPHCPTLLQLHLYDGNCEPDIDRDKRREACIVGSGRATEGYRLYERDGHRERIILKCILIEWNVMVWTEFICIQSHHYESSTET